MTTSGQRTAKQVIDQAIKDNRVAEWICYALAIGFASVGIIGFFVLLATGQPILTVASAIASVLFWPALSNAREIRKENIAIRLLEIPLSMASNEQSAAKALEKIFLLVLDRKGKKK